MAKLKITFRDGRLPVFVPENNINNFRRQFFNDIAEIISPDENGNYPEAKIPDAPQTDNLVSIIDNYRKENEALEKKIEELKQVNEKNVGLIKMLNEENIRLANENAKYITDASTATAGDTKELEDLKVENEILKDELEKLKNRPKPGPKPKN